MVETREREFQGWYQSIYIGRKRNSQINRSSTANTANQSLEKVEEELMKPGKVVGRKWTTGLMKLTKVVVHNRNIIDIFSKVSTDESQISICAPLNLNVLQILRHFYLRRFFDIFKPLLENRL